MKESFYFPHDYSARHDVKLMNVQMAHGMAGIGVFWCIIEMMYEQDGKLPVSSCNCIAFALHVDNKIVQSIFNDFDLFTCDGEWYTSPSVDKRIAKRSSVSDARRNAALKRKNIKSGETTEPQTAQNQPVEQMQNNCSTNGVQKPGNINININKNINNNIEKGKRKAFTPPTVQEVEQYCAECGLKNVDAQHFIDHYESNGWKVGKNPMKNWRSAVRNWSRHDFRTPAAPSRPASSKSSPTPNVNDIWK